MTDEKYVRFVNTEPGDQFSENRGYTFDSGFQMPTVSAPPSEPATPPPPVETQSSEK